MPENPLQRRAVSLKWRLVTGYTLAAFLTLSITGFFLHRRLREQFEIEDTELLLDIVARVRREVEADSSLKTAKDLIDNLAGNRNLEKYYGRLIAKDGTLLLKTPGMDSISPPPSHFPTPEDTRYEGVAGTSEDDIPLLMVAATVPRRETGEEMLFQVVLDVRHVEEWMSDYRNYLYFIVGGASIASGVLGWFITRRALRPLKDITATAQRITASDLNEHVGGNAWPEELALLAVEFDRMLARLRESFERLSQFTADAAHEFRTPLSNLLGGTSLALARPRSADDYRSLLEANLEEYHRLNHMMDSLLFLARADNAQTVVKKQPIEAGDAMSEVIDFFSALAEEHRVALTCVCRGSVTADPTLLRMALTNLVSNALRHSPHGTTVRLAAEEGDEGMTISVTDEGSGIAAEHLPRVFDRFYRAEESRSNSSESPGGSGLGLALVKTIMSLHGGSATVESTVGRGTTFRLHFPAVAGG